MTIQNQNSKIIYTSDGLADTYTVPFYFFNNEIAVYVNDTLQTINKDYIITNTNYVGGEIKFSVIPSKDSSIVILRNVPLTQLTTFIEGESFPASDYEISLDKIVMSLQMLKEILDRTIKFAPNSNISFDEFNTLLQKINQNYDLIAKVPALANAVNSIYEELLTNISNEVKIGPVSVSVADIVSDSTYEQYPYKLDIAIEKAKSTHIPSIIFSLEDAISSNYAPIAECFDGYVRIYLKTIPSKDTINIPIIFLQ